MPVVTPERWAQGLTVEEWIHTKQDAYHIGEVRRHFDGCSLTEADRRAFESLPGVARMLVICEECGSATQGMSVLWRILHDAGSHLEVRVFEKTEAPDLMQRYLKEGRYESVPVFVMLDDRFEEVAVLYEHPPEFDAFIKEHVRSFIAEQGEDPSRGLHTFPRSLRAVGWPGTGSIAEPTRRRSIVSTSTSSSVWSAAPSSRSRCAGRLASAVHASSPRRPR